MPRIMTMKSNPGQGEKLKFISLLKGLVMSYIITIPSFMLFALILANVNFPQRLVNPSVVVITIASVLTAGIVSTRGIKDKGWLNGGIAGFVYMLILYIASSLVYKSFKVDKYVVTMTIIGILAGAIGGIAGINTKKTAKYKHARR
ncbi:MAG: TIGR04086 family membrane protein [Acetivibrionales bacterium]